MIKNILKNYYITKLIYNLLNAKITFYLIILK